MDLYKLYKEISDRNPDKGIEHLEYIEKVDRNHSRYFIPSWLEIPDYQDVWVSNRILNRVISTIGLVPQTYYDLVILGLSSPDDRPTCSRDGCSNKVRFKGPGTTGGYGLFCSNSCSKKGHITPLEVRDKISKSTKLTMSKPEVRSKMSESAIRIGALPEIKSMRSRIQKEVQNRPEVKLKNSEAQKVAQNRPEVRMKRSNSLKGKKHSLKTRMKMSESAKIAQNKPETVLKRSESITRYHELNPDSVRPWGQMNYITGSHDSIRFGKKIKYDSSYERDFLIIVERCSEVLSISRGPRIPYYNSDESRVKGYYSDFILELSNGSKLIVEIKPEFRLSETIVIDKYLGAREYCSEKDYIYLILTEVNLYTDNGLNYGLNLYEESLSPRELSKV